jgi:GTPase SAR1 family protein
LRYFFFFLLGTKIDLREDRDFANQLQKQNLQSIKREQGQRLCKKIRAFKYVECSALTQKGLKQVCFSQKIVFSLQLIFLL